MVDKSFGFSGRNRRPATAPVNAMLNFGYSLRSKEIHGELASRGLNAYIGFMHRDRRGHASLASDMIEEWGAIIKKQKAAKKQAYSNNDYFTLHTGSLPEKGLSYG